MQLAYAAMELLSHQLLHNAERESSAGGDSAHGCRCCFPMLQPHQEPHIDSQQHTNSTTTNQSRRLLSPVYCMQHVATPRSMVTCLLL